MIALFMAYGKGQTIITQTREIHHENKSSCSKFPRLSQDQF
jgi:hypothetical protein